MAAKTFEIERTWTGSYTGSECGLHQLSPYIGKVKSAMAGELVERLTRRGEIVLDPFAGSGTVNLEAWLRGRHTIANDLSPYAHVLLNAKLFPPKNVEEALQAIDDCHERVTTIIDDGDVGQSPDWVKAFFDPMTLSEIEAYVQVLNERRNWFLLACLLGILHHQRPGFLSYPASHAVPYLRSGKYPAAEFPEMYEYRPVKERLRKKVTRAFRRQPCIDHSLMRSVHQNDASTLKIDSQVHAIVTSPPYMRRLSYARDNRLRLWFLGIDDHRPLDTVLSPTVNPFLDLMDKSLGQWNNLLTDGGYCALIIGDDPVRGSSERLPEKIIALIEANHEGFELVTQFNDAIPVERRVRRHASGSKSETILVYRKQ